MTKRIRSDYLKIIAMVCMLIDHIGVGILEKMYLATPDIELAQRLFDINEVLRGIGRIALPIFAYQVAVSMIYTGNRKKYIERLVLFSVISEIPFDLLNSGKVWDVSYQNVVITLLFGAIAIWGIDWFYEKYKESKAKRAIFNTAFVTLLSVIVELLKTDYGAKGVILIVLFYIAKKEGSYATSVAVFYAIEVFVIMYLRTKNMHATIKYCIFESYSLLAFPIIDADSGERGGGEIIKWVGYLFYPVHMLIIYLIASYCL